MRKIYKRLTKEQRDRGVMFTSTLSLGTTERDGDITHEVLWTDVDRYETIARLKNDRFFNDCPFYKYNIIRQ